MAYQQGRATAWAEVGLPDPGDGTWPGGGAAPSGPTVQPGQVGYVPPARTWDGAWNPDPTKDPKFAAIIAGLLGQETTVETEAQRRKSQADADLEYVLGRLGIEKPGAERRVNASLLSRGIYRSGEGDRRRGELAADFLDRGERARYAATQSKSSADAWQQGQLADLAVRKAAEVGDSQVRVRTYDEQVAERARAEQAAHDRIAETAATAAPAAAGGGGGGGGGGASGAANPDEYARQAEAYAAALAAQQPAAPRTQAPRTPMPTRPAPPPPARTKPVEPLRPLKGRY
jgi:hypothetical protein